MTNMPEQTINVKLLAAIESIKAPLSALALASLVNEFYSKEERRKMYAAYANLLTANN